MAAAEFAKTVTVSLTVEELAQAFSVLDDDSQARFFDLVAGHFKEWGPGRADMQLCLIGRHFSDCDCITSNRGPRWIEMLHGFVQDYQEPK